MSFTATVDTKVKVALKLYDVHIWHCSVRWPVAMDERTSLSTCLSCGLQSSFKSKK